MSRAVIGLGANVDDPAAQLLRAVKAMAIMPATEVRECSPVYRSAPMGPQDQPDFFNACALITTTLSPTELLSELKAIEQRHGRQESRRWGERCIDLDLLIYDNLTLQTATLTLPHPGIQDRDFVLQPMVDLLGSGATLPTGENLGSLLAAADNYDLQPTTMVLSAASDRAPV